MKLAVGWWCDVEKGYLLSEVMEDDGQNNKQNTTTCSLNLLTKAGPRWASLLSYSERNKPSETHLKPWHFSTTAFAGSLMTVRVGEKSAQ